MKVLFVCHANAGRSQTAKALYNLFTSSNDANAAGTGVMAHFPEGKTIQEYEVVSNHESRTRRYLKTNFDVDIADSSRIQLTPEHILQYDLVVNIAEKGQTPRWLRGKNVIWWDVKDLLPGDAVDSTFREVEDRVKNLIEAEKNHGDFHELDDDIDAEDR